MAIERKIVLLPFGLDGLTEASRLACQSHIIKCGGDYARWFEGDVPPDYAPRCPELARFLRIARHVRHIGNDGLTAMVVVTVTSPISAIFRIRADLLNVFPSLQETLWIIFADRKGQKEFALALNMFGRLQGELGEAPIWTVNGSAQRYLILTPDAHDPRSLRWKVSQLTGEMDDG
ncbi:hypothetical protein HY479_01560 [Candidatus Uhrbacteria bacterium]|nr:hypothetical protein [Candidatus Uhrbacteria bacterium]